MIIGVLGVAFDISVYFTQWAGLCKKGGAFTATGIYLFGSFFCAFLSSTALELHPTETESVCVELGARAKGEKGNTVSTFCVCVVDTSLDACTRMRHYSHFFTVFFMYDFQKGNGLLFSSTWWVGRRATGNVKIQVLWTRL